MADENIISLPELIVELAQNRKSYIFFIGNSIPQIYGAKSWGDICINLINACNEYELLDDNEKKYLNEIVKNPSKYSEVIMICKDHFYKSGANSIYQHIILKALNQNGQQFKIYKKLLELEPKHIITTNVDRHLVAQNGYTIRPLNPQELVDAHGIFYLHGSVDNFDEMVFTADSYDRVYSDENIRQFLISAFRNRILFIGYGLREWDILHYCRLKPEKYRSKFKSINLCGIPNDPNEQINIKGEIKSLWKRFKIFTCEFKIYDNKWSKLVDIISEIHATLVSENIKDIGDDL